MHSASISAAHLWGAAGSIILLRPRAAPWQLSDCFKTFFPPSHELLEELRRLLCSYSRTTAFVETLIRSGYDAEKIEMLRKALLNKHS
jgi:hypothetical protein